MSFTPGYAEQILPGGWWVGLLRVGWDRSDQEKGTEQRRDCTCGCLVGIPLAGAYQATREHCVMDSHPSSRNNQNCRRNGSVIIR